MNVNLFLDGVFVMDIIFGDFKNWISSKKELWKEQGLIMDNWIKLNDIEYNGIWDKFYV